MDVTSLSTSVAGLAAGRLKLEASTAVLGKALEADAEATTALIDSLSVVVPAGLTFSPTGLSTGTERRFIADL